MPGTPATHPVSPTFVNQPLSYYSRAPRQSYRAPRLYLHRSPHQSPDISGLRRFLCNRPIAVRQSYGRPEYPLLTMTSPVSIAPPASDDSLMNFNVPLIMLVISVSTVALFIWPALRAKRLWVRHLMFAYLDIHMDLEHKEARMHARVLQASEELSQET
ncbi:hypothetical protein F5878DRAFT_667221 [Lentinula raphanica]|uniref:Uncharacterized protein n=1 Tax=Lentinula raphanica TaxID=153919 RepID=A0AA38U3W9_9AGAR|nr:hypothetical protein F5878DRAFT_667221 [Lentinula raphanica]